MSTVLVVGGAGYIGSHMVIALLDAGHDVVVLDDLSRGHRDLVAGGELVVGNVGDRALLDWIFSTKKIDAVMHFAASSLVGESVEKPLQYYRNNVGNSIELLDAMRQHRVSNFIFSSTAAVYGEPTEVPITETHRSQTTNPYGATKHAIEEMLHACATAHDLRFVTLRYFNAAGADAQGRIGERHQPETHLIPLVLQVAIGERANIKIFGTDYPTDDGTCVRDYVHVVDLAKAHLLALELLLRGSIRNATYNLGNNRGYSVRQVISVAEQVSGQSITVVETTRRAGDPATLIAESSKARQELRWMPQFEDLEKIIETAWRWQKIEKSRKRT
jgi:UDP-glucose 4-epimerase